MGKKCCSHGECNKRIPEGDDDTSMIYVCLNLCLQKERITFGRSHSDNEDDEDEDWSFTTKTAVKYVVPKVAKKVCCVFCLE